MKITKRAISVLAGMTFAVLLLLVPGISVKAEGHNHDGISFEPWSDPASLPESGNYYLTTDVDLGYETTWCIYDNVNLCLNGKTISVGDIYISDITLTLYDNEGNGTIQGNDDSIVGLIYDSNSGNANFIMNGGILKPVGDTVFNIAGSVTINNGIIYKAETDNFNYDDGTVTVNNAYLTFIPADLDASLIKENTDSATKDLYPYVIGNPGVNNGNVAEEASDWLDPLKTQLNIAADQEFGANVNHTAEYTGDFALPKEILEFLKAHPDTTLVYTYMKDELTSVTVTISGKNVVLLDGVDYYGIDKLVALYGAGISTASGDYIIQPGDTLTSLAAKFGTTIEALLAKNTKITNRDLIYAGDKLNH